jgi:hypothetical protein
MTGCRLGRAMHCWDIRRLHTSPKWRSALWLVPLTLLATAALVTIPASAQTGVADPGLDAIMKMTPSGYQRAERDRLPEGPMTAATFNRLGAIGVPVRADNAVIYGASYERSDGAVIVFLGMSSSHRADGQGFADQVIEGTLIDGEAFSVGIVGVAGVDGQSHGARATAIAFGRNGRGFAVLSFGESARRDGSDFASRVVTFAESTPLRSDARPDDQLKPAAVGIAAGVALAVVGIVALWRIVQRRKKGPREMATTRRWEGNSGTSQTLEHPVHDSSSPRPSPRPSPR